jgi:BA14K-like protein
MAMLTRRTLATRSAVERVLFVTATAASTDPFSALARRFGGLPFYRASGPGSLYNLGSVSPLGGLPIGQSSGGDGPLFPEMPQMGETPVRKAAPQPILNGKPNGNSLNLDEGGLGPLAVACVVAGAALSGPSAEGMLKCWSADWYQCCANRYRNLDARTQTVLASDGNSHFCNPS